MNATAFAVLFGGSIVVALVVWVYLLRVMYVEYLSSA
jgi:hypothetical protein